MFVGHYSVSFGAKRYQPSIPLWVLFLAVQFLDVLWGLFVLLGIERVRIVPGITATNPLDLYYMPYTHSLVGAVVWSVLAAVAFKLWRAQRLQRGETLIVGVAVFSHWVLDLLVHRPDLPLVGNSMKVGLGLWNLPVVALLLEAALLFGGIYLFVTRTTPTRPAGKYAAWVFGSALIALQVITFFGAPPPSAVAAAVTALAAYFILALIAAWLDRTRSAAVLPPPAVAP